MKYRLFLIIATSVVLGSINTSCSRDNEPVASDGDQKAPISFNVNIGTLPTPTVTTRGYTTNSSESGYTFNGDEYVAVGLTHSSGSEVIKQYLVGAGNSGGNSLTYKKEADGTTTGNTFDWLSTTETGVSIRAWSDGVSTTASTPVVDPDGHTFTVETTQLGNVRELLYSPAASHSYTTSAINIPLYHQLSRIVVTIIRENTSNAISSVTIGHDSDGNRVPITGTFTKPGSGDNYGSWSVATETSQSTHWSVITPKEETTGSVYSAVVIPTTYTADMRLFNITIGTQTFAYNVPTGGKTFEAGKQYNYTITVGNKGITVTSNITDWTDAADESSTTPDFTHGEGLAVHSRLPIEYVAPYDMKSATEMATDNHVNNSYYFYGGGTSFSTNLVNFINGTAYPGYHLPSTFEWMSILPPYYGKDGNNTSETFDVDGGNRIRLAKGNGVTAILGEIAGWGVKNNSGAYTYEVYRKFYNQYNWPAGSNVSYAIRFMENSDGDYGIYTCAYRYTYNDVSSSIGSNSLTIDVKYIGLDETVTISTISNSSWWSSVDFTVTMPACGWLNTEADAAGSSYSGANAKLSTYYWSATPNDIAGYGYQARFYDEFIDGNGPTPLSYSYSVRLFRDRQ